MGDCPIPIKTWRHAANDVRGGRSSQVSHVTVGESLGPKKKVIFSRLCRPKINNSLVLSKSVREAKKKKKKNRQKTTTNKQKTKTKQTNKQKNCHKIVDYCQRLWPTFFSLKRSWNKTDWNYAQKQSLFLPSTLLTGRTQNMWNVLKFVSWITRR